MLRRRDAVPHDAGRLWRKAHLQELLVIDAQQEAIFTGATSIIRRVRDKIAVSGCGHRASVTSTNS